MISRYHQKVPSARETKAVRQDLIKMVKLPKSPVRLLEIDAVGSFTMPTDLGIFPQPSMLLAKKEA